MLNIVRDRDEAYYSRYSVARVVLFRQVVILFVGLAWIACRPFDCVWGFSSSNKRVLIVGREVTRGFDGFLDCLGYTCGVANWLTEYCPAIDFFGVRLCEVFYEVLWQFVHFLWTSSIGSNFHILLHFPALCL